MATVTTLKYLVFNLHIILKQLFVNLIAYGLNVEIKFEFKMIGNILWNALKANNIFIFYNIGQFSSVNSLDVLARYSLWPIVLININSKDKTMNNIKLLNFYYLYYQMLYTINMTLFLILKIHMQYVSSM